MKNRTITSTEVGSSFSEKASDFKNFIQSLPQLTPKESEPFEQDLKAIRAENPKESDPWTICSETVV